MRFPDAVRRTLWSCQTLVWLASWLVPNAHRTDWRSKWNNGIAHWVYFLAETGQLNRSNRLTLARHCWKAFPDALWQRMERDEFFGRLKKLRTSPVNLLLGLCFVLLVTVVATGWISSVRASFSTPIQRPDRVCLLTLEPKGLNGRFRQFGSATLLDLASTWRTSTLVSAVAPYSWIPARLLAGEQTVPVAVARVSPNFFEVLGIHAGLGRTFSQQDSRECPDCVLLSHSAWQINFGSDPNIVGQQVNLNGVERRVIGVLPPQFRLLSSNIAFWGVMTADTRWYGNFVRRIGAVVRLKDGVDPITAQTALIDLSEDAGYRFADNRLTLTPLPEQWKHELWSSIWVLLIVIGCAGSVAYARRSNKPLGAAPLSFKQHCRWWAFLAAKSFLLLAILYLGSSAMVRWISVDLAGGLFPMEEEVALWVFMVLSVLALTWAMHDQQKRCRVCLRRLGMPIDIGRPGSVLLNWSGTEMVCPEGHGMLYVSDSEASALEQDRWNTLDDSWAGLFR